jgi:hypothetical protein
MTLSSKARIAGFVYILASAVGIVRLLFIPKWLFVTGNAAATAANIATHEPLFRLGILSYLAGGVIWLFVPLALYQLLKDVDRTLAALMVILGGLMQAPMYIINTATDAAALMCVRGEFMSAFGTPQREALMMLFLRLHHHLDVANAILAGLRLIPFGVLVYKSRFLPRFLGVWLIVACFAWLAFCVTGLMWPDHAEQVFRSGQIFVLGEMVAMLWLVFVPIRSSQP